MRVNRAGSKVLPGELWTPSFLAVSQYEAARRGDSSIGACYAKQLAMLSGKQPEASAPEWLRHGTKERFGLQKKWPILAFSARKTAAEHA